MSILPIAVDAMGGDNAPDEIVAGCVQAVEELGVPIVLVGRPDEIGDGHGLEVIEASEVIAMDADAASSVRRMKDSSLVRAAEAVRDGRASAWKITTPARSTCPRCGAVKRPHVVCGNCGWYHGRQAIDVD